MKKSMFWLLKIFLPVSTCFKRKNRNFQAKTMFFDIFIGAVTKSTRGRGSAALRPDPWLKYNEQLTMYNKQKQCTITLYRLMEHCNTSKLHQKSETDIRFLTSSAHSKRPRRDAP